MSALLATVLSLVFICDFEQRLRTVLALANLVMRTERKVAIVNRQSQFAQGHGVQNGGGLFGVQFETDDELVVVKILPRIAFSLLRSKCLNKRPSVGQRRL